MKFKLWNSRLMKFEDFTFSGRIIHLDETGRVAIDTNLYRIKAMNTRDGIVYLAKIMDVII